MKKVTPIYNLNILTKLISSQQHGASPCPFLSVKEYEFLQDLYRKVDMALTDNEISVFRDHAKENLASCSYTPDTHKTFKHLLDQPEAITPEDLTPILDSLQKYYSKLLQTENACRKTIFSAYESWFEVAPINYESSQHIDRELMSLHLDLTYCLQRIRPLITINNNLQALLKRPVKAEITPHPALERTASQ